MNGGYQQLIGEKTRLLEKYLDTTLKMKAELGQSNMTEVQACINTRQWVIAKIDKIDKTLQVEPGKTPEENQRAFISLRNMKQLMEQIAEAEKECVALAKAERNRLKCEILDSQQIRHRTSRYRTDGAIPARFVDTKIR
ncbi:MAG: hypothetical protein JRJ04_03265 [Deltaproteobacteria bacterium]|nr:hypothetical protein [Deltaproteobacteria bacterium]